MNDRYTTDLQRGLEYQDFVFDQLRMIDGMPIFLGAYSSVKYQCGKGESPSGLEIKYDAKFRQTGNLFIETAEKSYAEQTSFHQNSARIPLALAMGRKRVISFLFCFSPISKIFSEI